MKKTLDYQSALRYNRQIVLPQFDLAGQEALLNASALIIGAGGLGCACSQYLVAAGIGALTLLDDDDVDISNLQRQILHTERDVGRPKVDSARQALTQLNSLVSIDVVPARLTDDKLSALIRTHTIVIDCSDNLDTRNQINRLCWQQSVPLVSGAAIRMEGQLMSFQPHEGGPCYACISHFYGEQNLNCTESGVLSPVVGIIGASQALLAIKQLTGVGDALHGILQLFDGSDMQWERINVPANPTCAVCSLSPPALPDESSPR